jgi:hypothetical protein
MAHLVAVVPKAQVEVATVEQVVPLASVVLEEIRELAQQLFTVAVVAVAVTTVAVVETPTVMASGSPAVVVVLPLQQILASL